VARYALIDGYLDTMRTHIRWRSDLDDLVFEMEDHLYSTVENLLATGIEPKVAQRTTLDRFGEPKVLAAVYASNNSGGIAVPTNNTIRAGTFALAAAFFWLAAAAVYVFSEEFSDSWEVSYLLFSAAILIAGVLGLLAAIGMSKRLGGLGVLGMTGLVITGIGVFVSIVAWALPLWMGLQGLGLLLLGIAVLRTGIAPTWSTVFTSSGFTLGIIAFIVANAAKIGDPDEYGDYRIAWEIGAIVGMVVVAIGLIGWGMWLRSEEPIDIDNDSTAITA
jgi:hypothetical protein